MGEGQHCAEQGGVALSQLKQNKIEETKLKKKTVSAETKVFET